MPRTLAPHETAAAATAVEAEAPRQRSWLAYAAIVLASVLCAALQPGHAEAMGSEAMLLDSLSEWVDVPATPPASPASAP